MRTLLTKIVIAILVLANASAFAQGGSISKRMNDRTFLTEKEKDILDRGPISETGHIVGSVLAFYPGFGIGQVAQGRWLDTGWIVTLGTFGSALVAAPALFGCIVGSVGQEENEPNRNSSACSMAGVGMAGMVGFWIYGIYDAIQGPHKHNRRYSELKSIADYKPQFMVSPIRMANNTPGLGFGFTF